MECGDAQPINASASDEQEGHDRSQVSSLQRSRENVFPATLLCRSRDFVKSSAERAHRWTGDAHRARGIAWTLFMRRERGPRLDMEPVDGSGKGVGEDERAGGGEAKRGHDLPVKVHARGIFFDRPAELRRGVQSWEGLA